MLIPRLLSMMLAILLINVQLVGAATILGKVALYPTQSGSNIHPLVAGTKMSLNQKALVRLAGATLIANAGTEFEAREGGEGIVLAIGRGEVYFKIKPEKSVVTFKTPQGEISSPKVVRASASVTIGRIAVSEQSTTVQIAEGEMRVLSARGLASLGSGQGIVLAQAALEEGAQAPPENLEELVDKTGSADSLLSPEGSVDVEDKAYDAVVVDDNLEPIEEAQLGEGTEVVVKGIRDGILLVQPIDRSLIAAWLPAEEGGFGAAEIAGFSAVGAVTVGGPTAVGVIAATQGDDGPASDNGEE